MEEYTNTNRTTYIDRAVGIQYSAGMEDMYIEFLQFFCEGKAEKVAQITESYQAKSWKEYVTYVHSVKSTSLSIGGVVLSELAAKVEEQGKAYLADGKEEALNFVKENHEELLRLYEDTVTEANEIIAAHSGE